MTWQTVALTGINVVQLVLLTWIGAWQARASHEVRKLNGSVVDEIRELGKLQAGSKPAEEEAAPGPSRPGASVSAP